MHIRKVPAAWLDGPAERTKRVRSHRRRGRSGRSLRAALTGAAQQYETLISQSGRAESPQEAVPLVPSGVPRVARG